MGNDLYLAALFLFTQATSQSPCLHETLALLSASGACLATTETECRGRDNYEKLAERVSHSLRQFLPFCIQFFQFFCNCCLFF